MIRTNLSTKVPTTTAYDTNTNDDYSLNKQSAKFDDHIHKKTTSFDLKTVPHKALKFRTSHTRLKSTLSNQQFQISQARTSGWVTPLIKHFFDFEDSKKARNFPNNQKRAPTEQEAPLLRKNAEQLLPLELALIHHITTKDQE